MNLDVQKRIDEIDQILAQPYDAGSQAAVDQRNVLINERAELVEKLKAEQEWLAQHQQTQAARVEAVDEMELPYDFNDIFGNAGANNLIRELLKHQATTIGKEHLEELSKLRADYQDKLRAAEEREIELKRQNDHLQASIELISEDRNQLQTEVHRLQDKIRELTDELQDRETKLRNAAAEIEWLNSHIEELQQQIANAPAPTVNIIDITPKPNASLDELVNKAKEETKRKLVNIKAIGGNWVEGINPETGQKEVAHTSELAELQPPEVEAAGENSFRGENPAVESQNSGISAPESEGMSAPNAFPESTQSSVDGSGNAGLAPTAYVTQAEFEELKRRVERIERHANLPVSA